MDIVNENGTKIGTDYFIYSKKIFTIGYISLDNNNNNGVGKIISINLTHSEVRKIDENFPITYEVKWTQVTDDRFNIKVRLLNKQILR